MTAKEKFTQWTMKGAERAQDPKNTFLHRLTMKILSSAILACLGTGVYFILDLRDLLKKVPSQEKNIEYLRQAQDNDEQKFGLILINDRNAQIETDHLRAIFQELDSRNPKPKNE